MNETTSAPDEQYRSSSQQRILKVMLALAGREVDGVRPADLAKGLKTHPSNITHDLRNLRLEGLADEIPETGRWRLTPRLSQIGLDMLDGIDRRQRKLDEIRARYTRNAT